jgi:hypothetical protein
MHEPFEFASVLRLRVHPKRQLLRVRRLDGGKTPSDVVGAADLVRRLRATNNVHKFQLFISKCFGALNMGRAALRLNPSNLYGSEKPY